MRVRELCTQVLWTVQGLDQGAARFPWDNGDTITADVLTFVNAALLAVATVRPEATATTESVPLSPGMRQHIPSRRQHRTSHDALTLLEVLRNMGMDGESPGPAIPIVEGEILRSMVPYVRSGYPVENYAYDRIANNQEYLVYPAVPCDRDVWIEVTYSAQPHPILDIDALLPVSDAYSMALVHHMIAGILSWDGEGSGFSRAQFHMAQFSTLMGNKTQTDVAWPKTVRQSQGGYLS